MAGRRGDAAFQQTGTGIGRRGIFAAAGAVLAGIVARQVSQPVGATSGGGADGNLVLGSNFLSANTAATITVLTDAPNFNSDTLFEVAASIHPATGTPNIAGLLSTGRGSGVGVLGNTSTGFAGALPVGYPALNAGVYGITGTGGAGVVGHTTGSAANTMGVKGINQATGAGGIGVSGQCDVTSGSIGVRGTSNLGFGVYGASNGGPGVFGTTTAAQNAALGGIVTTPGTAAFAGTATIPTAFAGFFTGDVFVNGNFTVNDPTRKHGAIQHPDGSLRLLYSMESPESWLEDFGKGTLANGKADVRLDADFAAVVQTGEYHVFLTPYDGVGALRAARRTAAGFAVEEIGGTSSGGFSYRVVARPKTTNKATRMTKFTIPDIKVPQPPPMPSVAAATAPDTPPQAAPPSRPSPPPSSSAVASPPQGSGTTQGSTTSPVQPAPPPRP